MAESKSNEVLVRPRRVNDGRGGLVPAPIPRQPGIDITRRKPEERSRHAIAAEGERLVLTPYVRRLLARGELERVEPKPKPEPAPISAPDPPQPVAELDEQDED